MLIREICDLLKREFIDNGYEYGFWLDGRTYRPDPAKGFDEAFYQLLLTVYRVQSPEDTRRERIGTCNDVAVLTKAMLDERGVPSRIWLLHDAQRNRCHTVLTFEAERKTVYLELTPRFAKPWYGKELLYENEQSFLDARRQESCEPIDVTEAVAVGKAPDFILSRLARQTL